MRIMPRAPLTFQCGEGLHLEVETKQNLLESNPFIDCDLGSEYSSWAWRFAGVRVPMRVILQWLRQTDTGSERIGGLGSSLCGDGLYLLFSRKTTLGLPCT